MISCSSSALLIRAVINCNSLSMWCRSLCWHPDNEWCSSIVDGRENLKIKISSRLDGDFESLSKKFAPGSTYAVDPICVVDPVSPLTCRKSSSISNTLANSDLDDRSFSSSSFIRLVSIIVFLVIFLPGLCILNIHGSHCRNTDFI